MTSPISTRRHLQALTANTDAAAFRTLNPDDLAEQLWELYRERGSAEAVVTG